MNHQDYFKLVLIPVVIAMIINICFHGSSLYMAGEACGQEWTGTVFGAQER